MRTAARRLAALLAALLLSNCGAPGPEQTYPETLRLLRDGDFAQAATAASRAASRLGGTPEAERFRLLAAEALLEAGKLDEAIEQLKAHSASPSPDFAVRSKTLAARRALALSDMNQAARLLEEAAKLATTYQRQDLALEASLLGAQLAGRQGRLADSEASYRNGRATARSLSDPYREAIAANGLGMLRLIQSRFDEAIPYFEEARILYSQGASKHWSAVAAHNLGLCYTQLGDFEKAQALREEALRITRPSLLRANALGESGTMHLLQQEPARAIELYRQARDMARDLQVLPDAARWASNLTSALAAAGEWEAAAKALDESLSMKPEPRSKVFLDLNAALIAAGRGRHADARAQYDAILAANPQQMTVRWQAEAGLANTFAAEKNLPAANAHFEAALRIIEQSRAELNRNEHKLTFFARLIRVYQDYVDFLVIQNNPAKALAIAESSRAKLLAERTTGDFRPVSKDGIHRTLPTGAVWLAYWLAPKRSFLWIASEGRLRLVPLPPAPEIAKLVENYRQEIEKSLRDPLAAESASGRRLYELLLAPAATELAATPRAIVVPDGALHQLSFETLPNYAATPPRYWNDEVTASVAPSLSAMAASMPPIPARPRALLLGNPLAASAEYPVLPQAGAELRAVAAQLDSPRLLEGADARPEAWAAARPESFHILHIAAHAEANRQSPLDSAIILSPGAGFRLFARDILKTPLRADLVTLSACRSSGARTYSGEGQVGLAWAFLRAGARSTVAGLWDVPDRSTALLMTSFYEHLRAQRSPPEALRRARSAVRQRGFVKPYYWGPFQCYLR